MEKTSGAPARTALLFSLLLVGSAAAQGRPSVQVVLGPAVEARVHDLGRDELDGERRSLADQVGRALARSGDRSASLTIVDIQPNRPTSAQLGRSPGLSESSFGLGGAAITGVVTSANGTARPLRFRFFQTERSDEVNFDTWGDAEQAFGDLAAALAAGRPPDDQATWPPPHRPQTVTGTRIPG